MSEGQKTAAWIAFCTIGGGALSVLFDWLICLLMNAILETDRFEAEPLRLFVLGALLTGLGPGALVAWLNHRESRPKAPLVLVRPVVLVSMMEKMRIRLPLRIRVAEPGEVYPKRFTRRWLVDRAELIVWATIFAVISMAVFGTGIWAYQTAGKFSNPTH